MSTYKIDAINISYSKLGESDKLLTVFSRSCGLIKLVAKGALKPKAKLSGITEPLMVANYQIAKGRNLDIIAQGQILHSNFKLRSDIDKLSCAFYILELTKVFSTELSLSSESYFDLVVNLLESLVSYNHMMIAVILQYELTKLLGFKPELHFCVICRKSINNLNISLFHFDLGGCVCVDCHSLNRFIVKEKIITDSYGSKSNTVHKSAKQSINFSGLMNLCHLTPAILDKIRQVDNISLIDSLEINELKQYSRVYKLLKNYLEFKIGRSFKGIEILD